MRRARPLHNGRTTSLLALLANRSRVIRHSPSKQRLVCPASLRETSHRTYFQPDSQAAQQRHPQHQQQYQQSQQQQQLHQNGQQLPQQQYPYYGGHSQQQDGTDAAGRRWPLLLIGFAAFPILWAALENASVRGMLPESVVEVCFPHFRFVEDMTNEIMHLKEAAVHQNDMHQATQRLFRELLTAAPDKRLTVARDDDIIARRPIYLDDGQRVAPDDACLLRVTDESGRNTLVVLGVDLDPYAPPLGRLEGDLLGLHRWLYQLVMDMHSAGATAFSTEGETMYILYTNNAIAMGPFFASSSNSVSSHTEITTVDSLRLPPGWPLQQLRQVEACEATDERVKALDGLPPSLTAEGLLGSDALPRGPFR